jgi:trimeric autotransporter adhesin
MTGAVAALSSGLVPALCLGEVFAPASTLTGLMKASASADAEARRRRDDPLPEDPATALLLSLVQPWPLHTRPPGGTSSVRALFVTRQAAEAAREELLLTRYAELVAARAAAGLPTTAAGEAARRAAMRAPGRPGGSGSGGSGGGGGGRGPHDHHGHSGPAAAAAAAAAGHHSALDTATASPQGWLRSLVSALLPQAQPPPLLPSPSVHRQAGGRQADGPDDVGAQQQMKQQMKQHGLPQSTATPLPLGSPPSVRHAGLPALLAAQLSAFVGDLSSLEDESVLREGETLLQARRSRQGGSSSSGRRRGSNSDTNAAAAAAAAAASTASGSMAGAATAFSFASHVVRMPLAAALSALQAQRGADAWVGACCPEAAPGQLQGDRQQQQQHDEKQQQQQEDRQQQQQQGDRQQQQQQDRQQQDKRQRRAVLASEPQLALAVAAADVVACLAARSGDAFLDGEAHPMLLPRHPQHLHGPPAAAAAASGGDSTAAWRLGLYGPEDSSDAAAAGSSEDSSCSEQQGSEGGGEEPHSMQAGAAAGGRSAGSAGSAGSAAPRRVARWRWGSDGGVRPARSPSPSPQAGGGNSVVGTSAEQRPPPGGNSSSVAGGGGNNVADDDAVLARAAFVPLSLDGSHPGGRAPRDNAVALPALLADMLSAVGGSSGASAGGQVAAGCTTILQAAGSGSGGGSAGVGLCTGATPAFELPGVTLVLDSSGGEVALTPVFLSLAHLAGLLDAGRAAATALWVGERRAARARWRAHVEAGAAAALGGGGLAALLSGGGAAGGGGAAAGGASAAAAGDDISGEGSDEDGLGDPPEAKALLEELGERGGPPQRRAAGRPPPVVRPPVRTGIIGALNATALGLLSLAARGAAGLQELGDQVTLALPPLAELAVGLPGSVNVSGVFLEDALADAAAHNAALIRGRRGSVTNSTGSSNTTGRAAGAPCSDSCTRRTGGSSSSSTSRHVSSPPPLDVPCLDALRLVLAAGWAIAADALNGSGELAAAVLGSGGSSSTGRRAAGGPSQLQVWGASGA